MIRVTLMYAAGDGATFDFDYYRTSHADIVRRSPGLLRFEIDRAIDGPNLAVAHLYFESPESLEAAMTASNANAAWADIPNFTNVQPVMQVGQIVELITD